MVRRLFPCLFAVAVGLVGQGCSDDCEDVDGDGFGEGCAPGPDCDDGDPGRALRCDRPAADCDADEFSRGCPCPAGSGRDCYAGDETTIGVGMCTVGWQSCTRGTWGNCEGAVVPGVDLCNGTDDDCDGLIDEKVLSPCGGCNPDCTGGVWGSEQDPFEPTRDMDLTAIGELTLARRAVRTTTVWVANTGEGTLSRIDADTAKETARYATGGETPTRVAIDHNGDVWVLNRSFGGQSTLTKIAGDPDRCANGQAAKTSQGPDDVLPFGDDDCVMLHVDVGGKGDVARTLAVDGARSPDQPLGGHVWVGLHDRQRVVEIDGESGEVIGRVETPDIHPYTSTFDPWGALWLVDREGLLARINPATDPPEVEVMEANLACFKLESPLADEQGTLYLSGFSCETLNRFEPFSGRWSFLPFDGVLTTRGIAMTGGEVWVAHTEGRISLVGGDPLEVLTTYDLADADVTPAESIAMGADSSGRLWVVSSIGGRDGNGVATRFDPFKEAPTAQVSVGRAPRGQGDITGSRLSATFVEQAGISKIFDGCGFESLAADDRDVGRPSRWRRVHVLWTPGVDSEVEVEARHAPTRDELTDAAFRRLGILPKDEAPFDVDFPDGGVVELRLTLRAHSRIGAPRISNVGLEWTCPGPD